MARTQQAGSGKAQTNLSNCMTTNPPPQKKLLSTKPHMDQLLKKENEIELNPNSINKEEGLDLKKAM